MATQQRQEETEENLWQLQDVVSLENNIFDVQDSIAAKGSP